MCEPQLELNAWSQYACSALFACHSIWTPIFVNLHVLITLAGKEQHWFSMEIMLAIVCKSSLLLWASLLLKFRFACCANVLCFVFRKYQKKRQLAWFEETFSSFAGDDDILQVDEFRSALNFAKVSAIWHVQHLHGKWMIILHLFSSSRTYSIFLIIKSLGNWQWQNLLMDLENWQCKKINYYRKLENFHL